MGRDRRRGRLRAGGQAFLGHDNYRYRDVLTNPATGAWFVVSGHALYKEMTARQIQGDIWEFTAHEAGQPFVVEDSDGKVVLRDRGRLTFRAVFDTLGDGQPGGSCSSRRSPACPVRIPVSSVTSARSPAN